MDVRGATQYRVLTGEGHRGDERLRHAFFGVVDTADGIRHRGQETLSFPAHQRFHQIVPPGVTTVDRHPRHAGPAHHVLDREPLQPSGGRLLPGGIEDARVVWSIQPVDAFRFRRGAQQIDEHAIHHRAATWLRYPRARSRAIWT